MQKQFLIKDMQCTTFSIRYNKRTQLINDFHIYKDTLIAGQHPSQFVCQILHFKTFYISIYYKNFEFRCHFFRLKLPLLLLSPTVILNVGFEKKPQGPFICILRRFQLEVGGLGSGNFLIFFSSKNMLTLGCFESFFNHPPTYVRTFSLQSDSK